MAYRAKKTAIIPEATDDFIPITEIPVLETWASMEDCFAKRLVRHIGVSNFNIPRLKNLLASAHIKPEINQIEAHPFLVQKELLEFCKDNNIHFTAYSPLGSRDTSGEANKPDLFADPVIKSIAEKHGAHPAQILIKWAESRGIAAIPKSINPERLWRKTLMRIRWRSVMKIKKRSTHWIEATG